MNENKSEMKAIFIVFNQAFYEDVVRVLERCYARGFTSWDPVQGRGSQSGEPHYGSHAWPVLNGAIVTIVEESRVDTVLELLGQLNESAPEQGLRAFVLPVEKML